MAERSASAFSREYSFPHLQIFADRNRVEKEETFELPAAARDRFMLEIPLSAPDDPEVRDQLVFESRFHDPDRLLSDVAPGTVDFRQLNELAEAIQNHVTASPSLRRYVQELWRASSEPAALGSRLSDVDSGDLIEAGPSPRGMSYLVRAAKVTAWLGRRDHLCPEDIQEMFPAVMSHRIFLRPVYEYRRAEIIPVLIDRLLRSVAAP
jgi:MoxR-like ATPase